MYGTAFRIARPLLQTLVIKRVAQYVAERLNERRERRRRAELGIEESDDEPDVPQCPPAENGYSSNQVIAFGLTGVLVGGALGAGLSYILREKEINIREIR